MIAALSNLPVLMLAVSSMFGGFLTTAAGRAGAVLAGLWVIAISSALRGLGPSAPMLFAMTIVMGAGIAPIQPAFPSLARAWFGDARALGTGIWANGLLCGEAISASLTIPFVLPLVGGSWERSFVAWSIPVVLTALALGAVRDPAGAPPPALARVAAQLSATGGCGSSARSSRRRACRTSARTRSCPTIGAEIWPVLGSSYRTAPGTASLALSPAEPPGPGKSP